MSNRALQVKAFAKINLRLRVWGRRDDGYHEIDTVFQSLDLHDTLILERQETPGIKLTTTSPWPLPERENLVYRAAELIAAKVGLDQGVRLHLEKRIPVGAGLGGGSSDAAATLVGLNELGQLKLSQAELHKLALTLGSDVPYFLSGGLCWGRGRGEILERITPVFDDFTFLLLQPDFSLSTEAVYREFDLMVEQGIGPPPIQIFEFHYGNDLEAAALRLCPEMSEYRRLLAELEPQMLGLSGSGPTYYAAWEDAAAAAQAARKLEQKGYFVHRTHPTKTGFESATTHL